MTGGWRTVALVARREVLSRGLSRATVVTTSVLVALVVAGLLVLRLVGGGDEPDAVGFVGDDAQAAALERYADVAGLPLRVQPIEPDTAAQRLRDGDLVAVVEDGDGPGLRVQVERELDGRLEAVVTGFAQSRAAERFLGEQGVDPQALDAATAGAVPEVAALDPPEPGSDERSALAYLAVLVLYGQLLLFGVYVAMGVVEEKSSRVVEVVLSTIRPLHLLAGKVLGLGVVALVQLFLLTGAALVTATATGLLDLPATAVQVFASVLVWFVLGYLLLAVLNAAAASLVSRQEDVSAVTAPVNLLVVGMFFVAQNAVFSPGGRWIEVLSFVPPFSAILMPLRVANDEVGWPALAAAAVLSLVVTALVALLAARIYERSVLRTGARVRLREVLRG